MRPRRLRDQNKAYNETPTKGTPMTKIDILKQVVGFVVGAGVTRIVKSTIENNIEPEEKLHNKVAVTSASLVFGSMARDATKDYTDAKIDEAAEKLKKLIQSKR